MKVDPNANQGRNRPATTSEKRIGIAFCIALMVMLASIGCTMISYDRKPPDDWPALQLSVVKLGFWDTQKKCGGNIFFQALACAEFRFDTMTCTIWTSTDDVYVMEHELAHCKGYDHIGSTYQADLWNAWKQENVK